MLDLQLQNPSDLLSFSTKWKNIQNKELIQYEDIPKKIDSLEMVESSTKKQYHLIGTFNWR